MKKSILGHAVDRFKFEYCPILIIAIGLLINSGVAYWQKTEHSLRMDFFTFWSIPQCLSKNSELNIYSDSGKEQLASEVQRLAQLDTATIRYKKTAHAVLKYYNGKIDATGTPFMYALFGMCSSGQYDLDHALFSLLSLGGLIGSVFLICWLLQFSFISSLLIASFLLLFFGPVLSDLRVGNLNPIQLLVITLYMVVGQSRKHLMVFLSGCILGFGIMFKPNIALILLFGVIPPLLNRDFQRMFFLCGGILLSSVLCFMVSSVYFDSSYVWIYFANSLSSTLSFAYPLSHGNFSFSNAVFQFAGFNISFVLLGILVALFIGLSWVSRRTDFAGGLALEPAPQFDPEGVTAENFTVVGMGCVAMLLTAGLAWYHYYTLLIPIILWVMRPLRKIGSQSHGLGMIRLLAFVVLLLFTPVPTLFVKNTALNRCVLVNTASILLLFMVFYEWWIQGRYARTYQKQGQEML